MSMFVYAAEPEVAPADEPQAVAEGLLYIQALSARRRRSQRSAIVVVAY